MSLFVGEWSVVAAGGESVEVRPGVPGFVTVTGTAVAGRHRRSTSAVRVRGRKRAQTFFGHTGTAAAEDAADDGHAEGKPVRRRTSSLADKSS